MPAYFDTGFSVREPMWHGEGLVLDEYPTDWNDARIKSGLTWEPALTRAFIPRPLDSFDVVTDDAIVPDGHFILGTDSGKRLLPEGATVSGDTVWTPLNEMREVIRDDTYAELGPVSDSFSLVYHGGKDRASMENIVDAFAGTVDTLKFETAGAAKGGKVVWALMYLDEPFTTVTDDTETYPFMALLNNHDGSGACKLVFSNVRVVCWNTYQAASMQGDRTGNQIVFRHVGDVEQRIDQAKEAIFALRNATTEWNEMSVELFGMKADTVAFNHFLADFIPEPPADVVSPRVRDNIDTARKVFKSIYLDSPTTESHRGTALGLVDAAVEYLDHVRGYRNSDTYMGRTLLKPEPLKAKATTLARKVCAR